MSTQAERHLAAVLDVAAAAVELPADADWWALLSSTLAGPIFGTVLLAVNIFNAARGYGWFREVQPAPLQAVVTVGSSMTEPLVVGHPYSWYCRSDITQSPLRVSDLVSPRLWRRMDGYAWMQETLGATNQLAIELPAPNGFKQLMSFVRDGGDFTDAEVEFASRLQPVLVMSVTHRRQLVALNAGVGVERQELAAEAAAALHITPRERVILDLMARGLSPQVIARQLHISVHTVYRHEQNIYRKLRVQDRHNAVLIAHDHLILP